MSWKEHIQKEAGLWDWTNRNLGQRVYNTGASISNAVSGAADSIVGNPSATPAPTATERAGFLANRAPAATAAPAATQKPPTSSWSDRAADWMGTRIGNATNAMNRVGTTIDNANQTFRDVRGGIKTFNNTMGQVGDTARQVGGFFRDAQGMIKPVSDFVTQGKQTLDNANKFMTDTSGAINELRDFGGQVKKWAPWAIGAMAVSPLIGGAISGFMSQNQQQQMSPEFMNMMRQYMQQNQDMMARMSRQQGQGNSQWYQPSTYNPSNITPQMSTWIDKEYKRSKDEEEA